MTWTVSKATAANSTIAYAGIGPVVHGKRERPHLTFNAAGTVTHITTGVGITPPCDVLSGSAVPGEQYPRVANSVGRAFCIRLPPLSHYALYFLPLLFSSPHFPRSLYPGHDCTAKTQYHNLDANDPAPGFWDR